MDFRINGRAVAVDVDLRTSLLDLLRDHLSLTGSKKCCNQGACGACTVLVDGERINSCLALAVQYQGRDITTVEGLQPGERGGVTDVQRAFVETGAVQCGFCTPGLIMAVHALLDRDPQPTDLAIREAISGNLCRCTGYGRIFEAVEVTQGLWRPNDFGHWRSGMKLGHRGTLPACPLGHPLLDFVLGKVQACFLIFAVRLPQLGEVDFPPLLAVHVLGDGIVHQPVGAAMLALRDRSHAVLETVLELDRRAVGHSGAP